MSLFNHLTIEHQETVKYAMTLHGLLRTEKGAVISSKKLAAQLNKLESEKSACKLEEKYKLAEFSHQHGLIDDESLNLAKDICHQLGVSDDDFTLASQYRQVEKQTAWQGADI